MRVDLNADMGESFGPWPMGRDSEILQIVSSANIACGFHAGDPDVMAETMRIAAREGVGIGAHPGFPDLQGFGRRRMHLSPAEVANLTAYQLGAAQAMAARAGGSVRHLKLHGALANMAAEDPALARAAYDAAGSVAPDIVLFVLAGTAQQAAAEASGLAWAGEIFADRAYNPDATLVDRSQPGALISDPEIAAQRIARMVAAGTILPETGAPIPAAVDTICLHGDGPTALAIATAVRARLEADGIAIAAPEGRRGPFRA